MGITRKRNTAYRRALDRRQRAVRREEVLPLRRERIDIATLTFRVEKTKTGDPQVAAEGMPEIARPWVSASETSASGHIHNPQHFSSPLLTKRLVNYARLGDVTEGYAADWTVEQLRTHTQGIADRIDELMCTKPNGAIEPALLPKEPGDP